MRFRDGMTGEIRFAPDHLTGVSFDECDDVTIAGFRIAGEETDDVFFNPGQNLARVGSDSCRFSPWMLGVEWRHSLRNAGIGGDVQD